MNIMKKNIKKIAVALFTRIEQWVEADLPAFANEPKNLTIERPRRISSPKRITFGDDVYLGPGSLLTAPPRYPASPMLPEGMSIGFTQRFDGTIRIGHRVTSTGHLTIGAHISVTIEDDVMLADNVMISDALHGYQSMDAPFKFQPMCRIEPILVKRGAWIGQNVVIMPGVTIGEMSIVGANSVVTSDIPDRCIAIGAPARVIKRWREDAQCWVSAFEDVTQAVAHLS
jgi:acetyltransferase-like isoleucine patch superfamily enzyme